MTHFNIYVAQGTEESRQGFERSPFHQVNDVNCGRCGAAHWFPTLTDTRDIDGWKRFIGEQTASLGCSVCAPKDWTLILGVEGGWPRRSGDDMRTSAAMEEFGNLLSDRLGLTVRVRQSHRENPSPEARVYFELSADRRVAPQDLTRAVIEVLEGTSIDGPRHFPIVVTLQQYVDPFDEGPIVGSGTARPH